MGIGKPPPSSPDAYTREMSVQQVVSLHGAGSPCPFLHQQILTTPLRKRRCSGEGAALHGDGFAALCPKHFVLPLNSVQGANRRLAGHIQAIALVKILLSMVECTKIFVTIK
ncbi:MAG: hypothetical protein KME30_01280 [Iphinoe sp. HA4291-MV1]|nr:hypothetical protein [Iphinoe sp. HA4291-MV1]